MGLRPDNCGDRLGSHSQWPSARFHEANGHRKILTVASEIVRNKPEIRNMKGGSAEEIW